jgi:hypothetical protein
MATTTPENDEGIRILSSNSLLNPEPGTTFLNINGIVFKITDKHVTVSFANAITDTSGAIVQQENHNSVTFEKSPQTTTGRKWWFIAISTAVLTTTLVAWWKFK